jgi:hypothetical protein
MCNAQTIVMVFKAMIAAHKFQLICLQMPSVDRAVLQIR